MTKERREEVILAALVLSAIVHTALMFAVRPEVMVHTNTAKLRAERHIPMRVVPQTERAVTVNVEDLLDLKPLKDAPAAQEAAVSMPDAPAEAHRPVTTPLPPTSSATHVEPAEKPSAFDAKVIHIDATVSDAIPTLPVEIPQTTQALAAPPNASGLARSSVTLPAAAAESVPAAVPEAPEPTPVLTAAPKEGEIAFTPKSEVFEKVDERIVSEEKEAVRALVNADKTDDLVQFVNVAATSVREGAWNYVRVFFTPRRGIPVVQKDVVVILDASGSVGKDRMASIRTAAKRLLRSVTNTGDRFNLVAFRDRFSYAFRSWQQCSESSFARSDKWLGEQVPHGRTDVFATIASVLQLPRDPARPLVALVVTDGDANSGVSDTAEILSRFTRLNDGLVSIYMYGIKSSANRELIDVLTHGNRGESFIFDGWRWNAGDGLEKLSERFRDPVLSDLRVVFASGSDAEAYPRLLRNLHRNDTMEILVRVPADRKEVSFSVKGLNGARAYEGFFTVPTVAAGNDPQLPARWRTEKAIDARLWK